MDIQPTRPAFLAPETLRTPEEREQAAEQFEEVFARQFVKAMTKSLFRQPVAEGGALAAQSDTQRDMMTDVLTKHLVESGALGIADLLLARWEGDDAGSAATHGRAAPRSAPAPSNILQHFQDEQPLQLDDLRAAFGPTSSD